MALALAGCGDRVPPIAVSGLDSGADAAPAAAKSRAPVQARSGVWTALDTRCGVLSVTIDGQLWIADPPLGDGSAPPGWGEEQEWGRFTPGAKGRAMFRGEGGQVALFRKAEPDEDDPAADCD